jgi:hypothetical protein
MRQEVKQSTSFLVLNPWLSLTSMIDKDGAEACSSTKLPALVLQLISLRRLDSFGKFKKTPQCQNRF